MLSSWRVTSSAVVLMTLAYSPCAAADSWQGGSVTLGEQDSGGATVNVEAHHNESSPGSDAAASTPGTRASGARTCEYQGLDIPCTSSAGTWSQDRECFVEKVSPQPDVSATQWNGQTGGAIYQCTPPGASFSAGSGVGYWFWAPASGETGSPTLVDPVTLAERAVDRMNLIAPQVGLTPLEPGAPALVGMETWLWIDNAGLRANGPITRTATAGPVSVTATAHVTEVEWDMGDGTHVTCRTAGTPWTPDQSTGPSPECGHRYSTPSTREPGGTFTVKATAHWRVDWRGAGQSGRVTFTMSGTRDVPVTELQTLQTG
jgi:hypothetical protein